jgi:hypothetical protein
MSDDESSSGIHISNSSVSVGGDLVGGDKITIVSIDKLSRSFEKIYTQIEQQPDDPNIEKKELKETVTKIEQELKKGDEGNPVKVERWLKFLGSMSYDIFDVVISTISNPALGLGRAFQLIAKKAKDDLATGHRY